MHDPENISADKAEIVMLQSDLYELFHSQADKVAVSQADDLEQPVEIVLAGTCHLTDNNDQPQSTEVQVRQRLDDNGTDYLLITGTPGNYYWQQITDNGVNSIYMGEEPATASDIEIIRRLVQPGVTDWNRQESERWATMENLYTMADRYARR